MGTIMVPKLESCGHCRAHIELKFCTQKGILYLKRDLILTSLNTDIIRGL